jgi:hypothetical protein
LRSQWIRNCAEFQDVLGKREDDEEGGAAIASRSPCMSTLKKKILAAAPSVWSRSVFIRVLVLLRRGWDWGVGAALPLSLWRVGEVVDAGGGLVEGKLDSSSSCLWAT